MWFLIITTLTACAIAQSNVTQLTSPTLYTRYPSKYTLLNNNLFFTADDQANAGTFIIKTNGYTSGTQISISIDLQSPVTTVLTPFGANSIALFDKVDNDKSIYVFDGITTSVLSLSVLSPDDGNNLMSIAVLNGYALCVINNSTSTTYDIWLMNLNNNSMIMINALSSVIQQNVVVDSTFFYIVVNNVDVYSLEPISNTLTSLYSFGPSASNIIFQIIGNYLYVIPLLSVSTNTTLFRYPINTNQIQSFSAVQVFSTPVLPSVISNAPTSTNPNRVVLWYNATLQFCDINCTAIYDNRITTFSSDAQVGDVYYFINTLDQTLYQSDGKTITPVINLGSPANTKNIKLQYNANVNKLFFVQRTIGTTVNTYYKNELWYYDLVTGNLQDIGTMCQDSNGACGRLNMDATNYFFLNNVIVFERGNVSNSEVQALIYSAPLSQYITTLNTTVNVTSTPSLTATPTPTPSTSSNATVAPSPTTSTTEPNATMPIPTSTSTTISPTIETSTYTPTPTPDAHALDNTAQTYGMIGSIVAGILFVMIIIFLIFSCVRQFLFEPPHVGPYGHH